jgi:AAA15 family ATPase/GTPase
MNIMPISQQRLKSLKINRLKNIKNFEIDFSQNNLTAIMGPNGNGKSTILHALACCYRPIIENPRKMYQFYQFFTPTADNPWKDSSFTIMHDYRDGKNIYKDQNVTFSKEERWKPRTDSRPMRHICYISIDTCVPQIEREENKSVVKWNSTSPRNDTISNKVREKAGIIMNRQYISYNLHKTSKSEYMGVEDNSKKYSAFSMGAGEQRIFRILTDVLSAPSYSLILIDEIDILLHEDALRRLIDILNERAEEKHLQIIFTTHSSVFFNLGHKVNVRHIYQTPDKTLCFNDTKADAMFRLTGAKFRPLEIFVEDDFAETIVEKICSKLDLKKYVSIKRYGSAINCFTLAAGILLSCGDINNTLFVIDGDVYKTEEEKVKVVNGVLTGNTEKYSIMRKNVIEHIMQFNLDEDEKPEKFICSMIKNLPNDIVDRSNEIVSSAMEIINVPEDHRYIDDIIDRIGYNSRSVGLSEIIKLAALSPEWDNYVKPIVEWLLMKKEIVIEK